MKLEEGQPAPSFSLPDQDGNEVSLDDLKGSPTVIYFYPKDETAGCTRQACDIRDRWSEFEDAGIQVIGISPDTVESHASFRENHDLPHTLLADPEHEVMDRYGAWGEKNLYGKKTVGPIRSAVLLNEDNVILKRWKRIGAKQHADRVLSAADELLSS